MTTSIPLLVTNIGFWIKNVEKFHCWFLRIFFTFESKQISLMWKNIRTPTMNFFDVFNPKKPKLVTKRGIDVVIFSNLRFYLRFWLKNFWGFFYCLRFSQRFLNADKRNFETLEICYSRLYLRFLGQKFTYQKNFWQFDYFFNTLIFLDKFSLTQT